MKVVDVSKLKGVNFTGGISYRAINEPDDMGFSVCKTVIPIGGPYKWHYRNHVEACYCIKGDALIIDCKTKKATRIRPDMVYTVKHDEHEFIAIEDTVLISVFNPPLRGDESHDESGNYV